MSYWVAESQEHGIGIALENDRLLIESIKDGVNLATVRTALSNGNCIISFNAYKKKKAINASNFKNIPDCLYWSWLPLFSIRAKNLLLSRGLKNEDFLLCKINGFPDFEFYLHLPKKYYDVLDYSKSKFEVSIPTTPPILQKLVRAVFLDDVGGLPCIFRVSALAKNQVLDDLLFSGDIKYVWDVNLFTGINFRNV